MSSRATIIVVQNGGNVQRLDKCCAFRRHRGGAGRGARAADGRDADRVRRRRFSFEPRRPPCGAIGIKKCRKHLDRAAEEWYIRCADTVSV